MHNPIITDLGFGDGGKGTMVDYLATSRSLVVRYCGGPQAAHNVIRDGRHHTFAQFGSGTFVGARTHLSRFMLINPMNMLTEERHLDSLGVHDAFLRTTVDSRAIIITPYHMALNRILEISRGDGRHGSCGQGIGTTRADQLAGNEMLMAGDSQASGVLGYELESIRRRMETLAQEPFYRHCIGSKAAETEMALLKDRGSVSRIAEHYERWGRLINFRPDDSLADDDGNLIFEGAQGVLLDETHGFGPYNTWTDCTPNNALTLLREAGLTGETLGVCRTYMTRHGAGPLPTEQANHMHKAILGAEAHNGVGQYQGSWRVGLLDLPLLRYAIDACGGEIDALAVTHLDRIPDEGIHVCESYRLNQHHVSEIAACDIWDYGQVYSLWDHGPIGFAMQMSEDLGVPLAYTSYGPTAADKEVYARV